MENRSDLEVLVNKIVIGLQKTREKLIATKIKEGQPLVVSQDGRVVHLDPRTMQEIKRED